MTDMRKRKTRFKYLIFLAALVIFILFLFENVQKAMYPVKYKEYVLEYTEKYGLDPYLVFAMIKVESNFKPNALSPKNARGLMQITDKTGKWGADVLKLKDYTLNSLYDPEINISIGCWYVNSLLREFGNDTDLALAAYNGGSGNVREWLKDSSLSASGERLDRIPFKETESYVKKVTDCRSIYKKLYENGF
jgi:soluble lytic murein transglycosylase